MHTELLKVDLNLSDEQDAEIKELENLDAAEAKVSAKRSPGREIVRRAEIRRKEILVGIEVVALKQRLAERVQRVDVASLAAMNYDALRAHVQGLIHTQLDIVVNEQRGILLRMAKGEKLDLPDMLMRISPWGVHALLEGVPPLVDKLVAPVRRVYGRQETEEDLQFTLSHRMRDLNSEISTLRDRIAELEPDDDYYEDPNDDPRAMYIQGLAVGYAQGRA